MRRRPRRPLGQPSEDLAGPWTHAEGRGERPTVHRCSNLPFRLRAASAVVPMPVRNARRRGIRMLSPSTALRHGASGREHRQDGRRPHRHGRQGKVKAGWHRARQHGGQCHPPCFLPCPYGPVAERRGRAWQPTHPPDLSLQPTQGRRRRSPPRSCLAPGRGRLRPPAWWPARAEPMGWFTGASGRARLGRWQPRTRRHDRLARHPPSRPIRGLGRWSPGRGDRSQAARAAGAAGLAGQSHRPGRGAGRRVVGGAGPCSATQRRAAPHFAAPRRAGSRVDRCRPGRVRAGGCHRGRLAVRGAAGQGPQRRAGG